jgi:protein phosphatase
MDGQGEPPPAGEPDDELLAWDAAPTPPPPPALDLSALPKATPVTEVKASEALSEPAPAAAPVEADAAPAAPAACAVCKAPRPPGVEFCPDCGWMFPVELAPTPATSADLVLGTRLAGRYEVRQALGSRTGVKRFRGVDHEAGGGPAEVFVLVSPAAAPAPGASGNEGEAAPADSAASTARFDTSLDSLWPTVIWEDLVLSRALHPSLPRVLDRFAEGGNDVIVVAPFRGRPLWDAWEDSETTMRQRFAWLTQVAQALHALHRAGAITEGLKPDNVVITDTGDVAFAQLDDLLPLPPPASAPIQATPYTAPELYLTPGQADARSDLYSFGAMLYALHVGRELADMDFERQGVPKPFVLLFPDAHPALARIVMKTFAREPHLRFPTEEAVMDDRSGFQELARILEEAGAALGTVRLDIAGWTSTGMVRTGNEDAFALLHAAAGRQHDEHDQALVLLADGMGGCNAGEVASAMAIDHLRTTLLKDAPFRRLVGGPPGEPNTDGHDVRELLDRALKQTNQAIYTAARAPGSRHRGMGCTAEIAYLDGAHLFVGHVGDSRTYHYSRGTLTLLTRDQTLVNRLIELGHLTEAEAVDHPRRHELQMALGGQPVVEPLTYQVPVQPGDVVLVCSDGLTSHVDHDTLAEHLRQADSAEACARRLVNLANLLGGSDNCTVVVVRLT